MYIQSVNFIEYLSVADYFLLISAFLLTVVNAVVSGADVAYFSLSNQQIDQLRKGEDRVSLRVSKLLDVSDRLSVTISIAFIFFNMLITALCFYLLTNKVNLFMGKWGAWMTLLVIFIYIFFFIEMLPKLYAMQRPMRFVRFSSRLISVIGWLFAPFSVLLSRIMTIFNTHSIEKKYELSLDDISTALELSLEGSDEKEKDILEGIIRFRDKVVEDILITRSDMVALDIEIVFSEVISSIIAAGFSRIPVYQENIDNIKGILYVKDLLPHIEKSDNFRWQSLIRPAYFVPGAKRIDDLLEEFRANKNHMAVVVDEYGGTSGIVTLEDILEEIVGDISDEYDEEGLPTYTKHDDGTYIFEGRTSLMDFMEVTGINERDFMEIGEGVDTLAGFLLELKGDFPNPMEMIAYGNHRFVAEKIDDRRIIKIKYLPQGDDEKNGDLNERISE